MKILLVDDEIVALNTLKKRVDWVRFGFTEVLTAQDVSTAKEILEKNVIDLVLTDIEMPGEDGLSLTEYVKNTYPETECMFVTCHASFDYIKKAMKYRAWDYILKPIDYEELEGLLQQFVEHRQNEETMSEIGQLVEKRQKTKEEEDAAIENRIDFVKKYIKDHLQEQLYVDDIAGLLHINSQHLMRIFKRETGQSILEYMTEKRIVAASKMLKETDYSISFIGDCIGCESSSYFTRMFKKYTGFTPKEYRQQFK